MPYIGILSDTHGYLGDFVFSYFADCEEIWHAGDIGSVEVLDKLQQFKPVRAVYGNIDGGLIKRAIPEVQEFEYNGIKVFMKHIVGYPSKYDKTVKDSFSSQKYNLVVAGHSHLLRIMYDKTYQFLYVNPGAAGRYGIHQKITLVKLEIVGGLIKNAFIWEKER